MLQLLVGNGGENIHIADIHSLKLQGMEKYLDLPVTLGERDG